MSFDDLAQGSSARARFGNRLAVLPTAMEAASILFVTTALVGFFTIWRLGESGPLTYLRVAFDPAFAAIILTLTALILPSLIGSQRLRTPLNFTLPLAYFGILLTFKFMRDDGKALAYSLGEPTRVDLIWYSPSILGSAVLASVIVMSVVSVVSKRHRGDSQPSKPESVQ